MSAQWKLVPVEPTESMVINGFESVPDECFTDEEVWEQYQEMSGCQQAAFRAKLCWAAMIAAAPTPPQPTYDEEKERELFEASATSALGRDSDGYYIATDTYLRWQGWKSCAQSRAKSVEVGDE